MFETTYLQVAKACDQKRRDFHEHTKLALVSQANSHDNQEDEEEYDWSENNDVVSIQEIEKKDEKIAQLKSEMEKLMSEKEIKKDENSSYVEMSIHVREKMCTKECFTQVEHYRVYSFKICDKLKKEETMHKNLQEQHKALEHRITSLQESLKKSEQEVTNIKNEAAKSNEHSSSVIKDLQEEITMLSLTSIPGIAGGPFESPISICKLDNKRMVVNDDEDGVVLVDAMALSCMCVTLCLRCHAVGVGESVVVVGVSMVKVGESVVGLGESRVEVGEPVVVMGESEVEVGEPMVVVGE
ncbi:hypothetical protein QVD17_00136 [Tagetes erecta]|uniref:Uncharacterized protein n=1 Tax=Tagetes erecta TaxID=13708 RepID=A0AAD8L829_TARER|nr:hypothetical protein QVD17_00136 [Tagetes erecta]